MYNVNYIFFYSMDSSRLEDEHKLIARYAMRLAQEARAVVVVSLKNSFI